MNVIDPQRRLALIQLLILGYSMRSIEERISVNRMTALRYMRLIGMKRSRGHRSPNTVYRHANQSKEWYLRHHPPELDYDPSMVRKLMAQILAEMTSTPQFTAMNVEMLQWKQGKQTMIEIKRLLKERTNRQSSLDALAVVE